MAEEKNKSKTASPEPSTESKAVVKKITSEEVRDLVKKYIKADCDPDQIFQRAAQKLETYRNTTGKKELKKLDDDMKEIYDKSLILLGLDTHYALAETISERYRPLVIEVARQVEKEYGCTTPSEKILAETIAGAYGKIIEYSRHLNNFTRIEYLSNEKNGFYAMVSKEVDRAHRQLNAALTTLKMLKNPSLELNINAKTAFVAQNQNLVSNQNKPNETIDSK